MLHPDLPHMERPHFIMTYPGNTRSLAVKFKGHIQPALLLSSLSAFGVPCKLKSASHVCDISRAQISQALRIRAICRHAFSTSDPILNSTAVFSGAATFILQLASWRNA
eukprot:Gregarina_sp_Poly_1__6873@NODE_3724_length_910_cov_4_545670_g2387_i0_p1_GENE_NODE_3724_length_910_cov_4_545670_g2387_i0NODE_3724_length_910_cov_4_545670_g2387_i0_p1_ORF_typecomplete_len109_score6_89_NODE_3724_length_910_cov_4_545670_g2387_i092418